MDYRKKIDYVSIVLPQPPIKEDRGTVECCCSYPVYGDLTSSDKWKNDIKLVWERKTNASDTIEWTIEKCGTGLVDNLGTVAVFPNDSLGVGFMYDWNQYLDTYGVGAYTISITFTISGVSNSYAIGTFNLDHYAPEKVDGTILLRAQYNSLNLKESIDFTNSNCIDSLRVPGFFGARDLNTQINNHLDVNRKVIKSTREYLHMFDMEAEPLTDCESVPLRFMLLNEDNLFLSDFNSHNHEQFFDVPVVVENLGKPEYLPQSRFIKLICTFGDRVKQDKVYYNV